MTIQPQQATHGIFYGFLRTVKIQPLALPLEPILLNSDAMSLLLAGYSWPAEATICWRIPYWPGFFGINPA